MDQRREQSHHHKGEKGFSTSSEASSSEASASANPGQRALIRSHNDVVSTSHQKTKAARGTGTRKTYEEDDSPPPQGSSPTTGTITTPASSVGTGSSSPTGHHHGLDRGAHGAPHFPNETLEPGDRSHPRPPRMTERPSPGQAEWGNELIHGYGQSLHPPPDETSSPHVILSPTSPSHHNNPAPALAAIKFLVSNNVAGSIIGRAGQTISELQKESATRIKLSQSGDYYPGTQERVCLVQGQPENVKRATSMLLTRLYTLQQQVLQTQNAAWKSTQSQAQAEAMTPAGAYSGLMFDVSSGSDQLTGPTPVSFVVRILIPTPCCGMIIGKSGSNIKELVDISGVTSVRLAPKEGVDPSGTQVNTALVLATSERAVTVVGVSLNCCIKCLFTILDSMSAHPEISRYTNMTTSYSRTLPPGHEACGVHTTAPSAAGFIAPARPRRDSVEMTVHHVTDPAPEAWDTAFSSSHTAPHSSLDPRHGGGSFDAPPRSSQVDQGVESAPSSLQSGFVPHPASPLVIPRESFQYSPVFGGAPPVPFATSSPSYPQSPSIRTSPMYMPFDQGPIDRRSHAGGSPVHSSFSAPDFLSMQFQESVRVSPDGHPGFRPVPAQYVAANHATAAGPQNAFLAQVSIPDNLIGSVLGRGGRTLTEIQQQSNTRIRISQKGEYVPGTKNRIVTIRGPTAQSVITAQFLMSQRIVLPPTAAAPDTGIRMQPVDTGTATAHIVPQTAAIHGVDLSDCHALNRDPTSGDGLDASAMPHPPRS